MNFLLYYILRRFFLKLEYTDEKLILTKGVFLKRTSLLPLSAVVKIVVKQPPILRIFRAKEVGIFTHNGKVEFFLSKNEQPPFIPTLLPVMPKNGIRPRFREIIFGALIDTRALAGIAFFAAALQRIGSIVGSSYFDKIISALFTTAEKLSETLMLLHVAVPKIAAFAAVFAACSWLFAFCVKLVRLSGFRLSRRGKTVYVKSGAVTLYETFLVQNTAAVITRKTVLCMLFRCSPVYYCNTVVYPAASEKRFRRIASRFFGVADEFSLPVKTPPGKIACHCLLPLWTFGISSALLVLFYLSEYSFAQLLKTVLYCAVFASGYISLCGMLLMRNALSSFGENTVRLSFRRGTAVYRVCFPRGLSRGYVISKSIFSRGDLYNYKALIVGQKSYRARRLPIKI